MQFVMLKHKALVHFLFKIIINNNISKITLELKLLFVCNGVVYEFLFFRMKQQTKPKTCRSHFLSILFTMLPMTQH